MSLSRPRAVITVAGRRLTSAEAALLRLRLSLGIDGQHDAIEAVLWPASKLAGANPGDAMTVALGEDGDEQDVWTGEVTAVSTEADAVVLEGLAATVTLSRTRKSQFYASQSVADIVRDLASAGAVDEVQGDTSLEAYAVDDRRTVWAHLVDLAALAGCEVGAAASGGLRFVPPRKGAADHRLRRGAELLDWRVARRPKPTAASVSAHGAASEEGSEKWHWLLRAPASGSGAGRARVVGAFHNRDAADALGRALADQASRATIDGSLRVVGAPSVRPGDLVQLEGVDAVGDPLRVRAVEHVLDARAGFVTTLSVEGAA